MGTTSWDSSAVWWGGDQALENALARELFPGARVRVVVDGFVAGTSGGAALLARIGARLAAAGSVAVPTWAHDATATDLDHVLQAAARWKEEPVDLLVLVGGGSTLDLGLLASLTPDGLELLQRGRSRSGLMRLPVETRASCRRLAVPTTLGTGAEQSGVACLERSDGKVLIIGSALRPEAAACDPAATVGLSGRHVRQAAIEVLARLVVPYAAPSREPAHLLSRTLGDRVLFATLDTLLEVAGRMDDDGGLDADGRLVLAATSAHSHGGFVHVGRVPHASPVWFVATELAPVLRVTKAESTALLLPAWAALVLQGRAQWGDASRLRGFARHAGGHGSDPQGWLVGLLDRLLPEGVEAVTVLDDQTTVDVADTITQRWGAGLPMLGALNVSDIEELLRVARAPSLEGMQAAAS